MTKCEGVEGARSTMIDGFKIAEHIRAQEPEYFALLSKVSLPYQLTFKDQGTYKMRRYTFATDDENEMSEVHLNNIDRRPIDSTSLSEAKEVLSCDDNEAIRKMYQALRYLYQLVLCDKQFAYRFDLTPGKMLLMHNHRIFHARDEVVAGVRSVYGIHNGKLEWLGKMKLLESKYS